MTRSWIVGGLLLALALPCPAGSDDQPQCEQLWSAGDYDAAFPVCKHEAEKGNAKAQYCLAGMYLEGKGVLQDYAEAAKWYRKAAEQGVVDAQDSLGLAYSLGVGVPQDDTEAVKWYRKAAEQGDPVAQYDLARSYTVGKGVPRDDTEAAKWYRKAAEQGHPGAQYSLALLYALGEGVPQDDTEAAKWYRKAAEGGDPGAQYFLALHYSFGQGVPQDKAEAAKWFREAAQQGNADAQFSLGMQYAFGIGVPQDDTEAAKWYRKAAQQGHADAQFLLGMQYAQGKGVPRDDTEAAKWFRKAAEQGDAAAQFALGMRYAQGTGVPQDGTEAAKRYRKAAEQGNADAQFLLGMSYAAGSGVLTSGAAAADWYYKAGLSYLRKGQKDDALRCVERIRELADVLDLTVPNSFLADRLLATIYGKGEEPPNFDNRAEPRFAPLGTAWPVAHGYIVTNFHVIKGRKSFQLQRVDGVLLDAIVAAKDEANDLALLKVGESGKLPPALPLAARPARVGEKVFTIGFPHPTLMGTEPKLTDGVINSLTGLRGDPRTYQISVPLQPGSSGGPLLNMRGEVVGITTSKLDAATVFQWTGDIPENVNYAVKVQYLSILLSTLPDAARTRKLTAQAGTLPELAERIERSVMILLGQ